MMLVEPALDDPQIAAVRAEEEIGDGADPGNGAEQEVEADIPGHPGDMPFRHAEVARFPDDPGAEARRDEVAGDGNEVEHDVEAHRPVEAGDDEHPLEQFL